MAYMCADSGNLMAIAQQVIQQKQQQQQQQQQQQHLQHHHHLHHLPFSSNPSPWPPHENAYFDHHFPFPDPFAMDASLPFPPFLAHLDNTPFGLSDFGSSSASASASAAAVAVGGEFDSDEWMESLIGESPAESSDMMSDAWQGGSPTGVDLPPFFSDAFEINRLIFSGAAKIAPPAAARSPSPPPLPPLEAISFDPPPAPPSQPKKDTRSIPQDRDPKSTSPPLLKSLLECARIADSEPDRAVRSLAKIKESTSDFGDPTERVAFYFAEALSRRIASSFSPPPPASSSYDSAPEEFTLCYKILNDACPYSKFAHLTANQAILEATESATRIHIVDFGIVQGIQWAAFLQALATRSAGKPTRIRISGIPSPLLGASPAASLAATGARLRDFAALLDLDFEFVPILTPIHGLSESTFRIDPDESVAVNFMVQLYHLLGDSPEPVHRVLRIAQSLHPRVVTLCEYEVNLNRVGFVDRFAKALTYYAALFDSLEPAMSRDSSQRVRVERFVFGHRIQSALGPGEGPDRTDRMGEREEWRALMEGCGLEPVPLTNYAVSQAKLLLWNYDYSAQYTLVESDPSFLSLAWEGRPLLTVSSWR